MYPDPYQAPRADASVEPREASSDRVRTLFILAGVGALLAAAYWAALTLLLGFGAAMGTVSPTQILLPCILIALYAVRGFQLFKGNPAAANRILWLHGFGAAAAIVQMLSGGVLIAVFQTIKIAIHIFGAAMAYLALRAYRRAP